MHFFAHPGHEHAEVAAAQTGSLNSTAIIILVVVGVSVIGIVVALIIAKQTQKNKATAK